MTWALSSEARNTAAGEISSASDEPRPGLTGPAFFFGRGFRHGLIVEASRRVRASVRDGARNHRHSRGGCAAEDKAASHRICYRHF